MVYISGANKNRLGKHCFDAHFGIAVGLGRRGSEMLRGAQAFSPSRISSGRYIKDDDSGLYLDPRRSPCPRFLRCIADGSGARRRAVRAARMAAFSKKEIRALRGKSYQDIAFTILSPFTNGEFPTTPSGR
jgi:hypothetical protein